MRAAVAELRRSGELKANETAAFDTPDSAATSAMRARAFIVSTPTSTFAADWPLRGAAGPRTLSAREVAVNVGRAARARRPGARRPGSGTRGRMGTRRTLGERDWL